MSVNIRDQEKKEEKRKNNTHTHKHSLAVYTHIHSQIATAPRAGVYTNVLDAAAVTHTFTQTHTQAKIRG